MEPKEDYEIEIWMKRSTSELLKKFITEYGFADNDEAIISLIEHYRP